MNRAVLPTTPEERAERMAQFRADMEQANEPAPEGAPVAYVIIFAAAVVSIGLGIAIAGYL